eukprot:CAMPEP_0202701014 /NCGR_PEP_ID=MMETSP1385-20130828/14123_1 /ASSEMBLY_ACC=CAM_ASM_000861 /TAXON_ID=933848 /ORGANISM="Elphidium margaritaceum" /LENGTH=51 /DNA_ID=CAMNT_0049358319 /DNA_START=122 /DNA_END=273 /DNA_ORIENTATION=+
MASNAYVSGVSSPSALTYNVKECSNDSVKSEKEKLQAVPSSMVKPWLEMIG